MIPKINIGKAKCHMLIFSVGSVEPRDIQEKEQIQIHIVTWNLRNLY